MDTFRSGHLQRQHVYQMKFGERTIFLSETLCLRAWELILSLMSSWFYFLLTTLYLFNMNILLLSKLTFFSLTQETYCDMLVKYKSDLARPFDEATTFLNKVEMQLRNLCTSASVRSLSGQPLFPLFLSVSFNGVSKKKKSFLPLFFQDPLIFVLPIILFPFHCVTVHYSTLLAHQGNKISLYASIQKPQNIMAMTGR